MNIIILTGRLTRDPELKYGQSGKAYSRITLAIPRKLNKEETDFINCVGFGKTAEVIGEYLRKGKKVGITGRLQMNQYEYNGEKRTSYDVMIENLEFLEGKIILLLMENQSIQNQKLEVKTQIVHLKILLMMMTNFHFN